MPPLAYEVDPPVAPIRQPLPNACWATVTTMLLSWKHGSSLAIRDALQRFAPDFVTVFDTDTGLSADAKPDLLAAVGLTAEAPQSYTAAGWDRLLRRFKPIWVTTGHVTGTRISIHARLLVGIAGDGSPLGTTLHLIDPADGHGHLVSWQEFANQFEAEARHDAQLPPPQTPVDVGALRVQVLHW